MIKRIGTLLVLFMAPNVVAHGEEGVWNRVCYKGGMLETSIAADDWENHLSISPALISLRLRDGQVLEIPAASVTGLSYGREAHRRLGMMAASGMLVSPITLISRLHQTHMHFIGAEYVEANGVRAGLLLQAHEDNYRQILRTLKSTTGSGIAVSGDDRRFVADLDSYVVPDQESVIMPEPARASQVNPMPSVVEDQKTGQLHVVSYPVDAEVRIDEVLVGHSPAAITLAAGTHVVWVTKDGYEDWIRQITVLGGAQVNLNVTLEPLK